MMKVYLVCLIHSLAICNTMLVLCPDLHASVCLTHCQSETNVHVSLSHVHLVCKYKVVLYEQTLSAV